MKTFLQFISESSATQQAARLGLEGDGHGGWYKDGEFVAKTEKGRLKFYNKRQRVGQDPPQSDKEKNLSSPNTQAPPEGQVQAAPQQSAAPQQAADSGQELAPDDPKAPAQFPPIPDVPKTKGTLTVAFGRFNPPHAGHGKLIGFAAESAESEKGDYMIIPSRSEKPKTDPMSADSKVEIMRSLFPEHSERIVNDPNIRTILMY